VPAVAGWAGRLGGAAGAGRRGGWAGPRGVVVAVELTLAVLMPCMTLPNVPVSHTRPGCLSIGLLPALSPGF
jgi:hypothetical protein